jgi:hypothetical protein
MGAAAIKMTSSEVPRDAYPREIERPHSLDADCSGNSTCVSVAAKVSQSLSTTTKFKLSDQELDSLWNDGSVLLRGVLTNQKLLEEMGQQISTVNPDLNGGRNLMNINPFIRALINHTNVRSMFEQIAKHTPWNVPVEVNCDAKFFQSAWRTASQPRRAALRQNFTLGGYL